MGGPNEETARICVVGLLQYHGMSSTDAGYMSVAAPATARMQQQQELEKVHGHVQEQGWIMEASSKDARKH
jgi:hypothetical protein